MEMSDQLHAPAASPPGKVPRYPLDRRLDYKYRIFIKIRQSKTKLYF